MGQFHEQEVKKMSEALSIFGQNDKGFIDIYNASRKDKYDFLYLSVEHMEARRNHENLLWSSDTGFHFNKDGKQEINIDQEKTK